MSQILARATPTEVARATHDWLHRRGADDAPRLQTPIRFWRLARTVRDASRVCPTEFALTLVVFGPHAGYVMPPRAYGPRPRRLPADADSIALDEFRRAVRAVVASGWYAEMKAHEGPNVMAWYGVAPGRAKGDGPIHLTISAERCEVRPDDEAVAILAGMLRGAPPALPRVEMRG